MRQCPRRQFEFNCPMSGIRHGNGKRCKRMLWPCWIRVYTSVTGSNPVLSCTRGRRSSGCVRRRTSRQNAWTAPPGRRWGTSFSGVIHIHRAVQAFANCRSFLFLPDDFCCAVYTTRYILLPVPKKLYNLDNDDLIRLRTIRESEGCASDVEALRICIREKYTRGLVPFEIVVESSIPPNELHYRDGSGKIVGKIVNIGESE